MAKLSAEIERDVKEEMHWHRGLDASYIAVSANGATRSLPSGPGCRSPATSFGL